MQPIKSSKIRLFNKVTLDFPIIGRSIGEFKKNEPRKFQAYCVGLPRSGTHSIANIFNSNFKAAHEPFASGLIKLLSGRNFSDKAFTEQFLLTRDRLLCLEMEANHLLHRFTPQLVEIFPASKFILTVREPYSWVESEYNMILKANRGEDKRNNWRVYDRIKYGQKYFDDINSLDKKGGEELIKSMLRYYRNHIKFVLNSIPKDRLMVLDTFKINKKNDDIGDFLECDRKKFKIPKKHSAKNKKKTNIQNIVSSDRLQNIIAEECEVFIDEHVPILAGYIK